MSPATTQSVTVVTDSTAYLPAGIAAEYGVVVVPLHVRLGEREFAEGVDLTTSDFVDWMSTPGRRPFTSQPTPAAFAAAYDGAGDSVVSPKFPDRLRSEVVLRDVPPEAVTDGRKSGWYVADVVQRGEPC